MKTDNFKSALQAELTSAGFSNKIKSVDAIGRQTTIFFAEKVMPHTELSKWLHNKFNGVTLSETMVIINSTLPKLKAMQTTDGEAGRLNEPFASPEFIPNKTEQTTEEKAIQYVKNNWCDYSTADGGWDSAEGYQCFLAGHKLAKEENKTAIEMHDKLVQDLTLAYRMMRREEMTGSLMDSMESLIKQAQQK